MKIASYNIMSGGFNDYIQKGNKPDRLSLLQKAVKKINADFIGLVDTFRWKEILTREDLKRLFGYKHAFHIDMDDDWVDKKIGIAALTNLNVRKFQKVRIKTTSCIKAEIEINKKIIGIYTAYLNYLSEQKRLEQARALLNDVDKNSTIIMGDLNTISPKDLPKLKSDFNKFLQENPDFKKTKDYNSYYQKVAKGLYQARVIPLIKSKGFVEATGKTLQATAYTQLPGHDMRTAIFRLDHLLHTPDLNVKKFEVLKGGIFENASDHYPIVAEIF